jgi:DNA-binding NtrC family response regulator
MPDEIIGGSPALRKIRAAISRLASERTPIIITGEAGVGKSLVASHIHSQSPHRSSQLEIINFSILRERDRQIALLGGEPPELTTTRRSSLENSTTLVLKHLDQANTFLQERLAESLTTLRVARLGSAEKHLVSARIIFTFRQSISTLVSNRQIHPALAKILGSCRRILIPPLRKRKEDIPVLAEHFLHQFFDTLHSLVNGQIEHVKGLTSEGTIDPALTAFLIRQKWPGNVTELKAYLRSLIISNYEDALQDREKIEVTKMVMMVEEGKEFSLWQSLSVIEQEIIHRALSKYEGHQTKAAQMLGITGRSIRRRMTLRIILFHLFLCDDWLSSTHEFILTIAGT